MAVFLSLLSPNITFTTAFQLQPECQAPSTMMSAVDTARDEDAHALDGCQSPAANISHRKKGHFSPSFSPLSDLNRISQDMEKLTPLPSRSFSPAKFQRSVANHLWFGFLQAKGLQGVPQW